MRTLLSVSSSVACLSVFVALEPVLAEEYRAIFWNLESGESSTSFIASQMVEKDSIDFWGLSEVPNQAAVNEFEQALEAANPGVDFISQLSEEGRSDRLAILYRSDRLTSVPYTGNAQVDDIGNNFFEVDSINVGNTIRPALGVQLQTESGQMVIMLVNHWKCCGGNSNEARREQQAIQMNAFAVDTPVEIPMISGGDFNIPFNRGGQFRDAFEELSRIWNYEEPAQTNVGTHRGGTVLDAVFIRDEELVGWDASTTILSRSGNSIATTSRFADDAEQTDHRPLLLVIESDTEGRIEALREAIAETEALLENLRQELSRLEAENE